MLYHSSRSQKVPAPGVEQQFKHTHTHRYFNLYTANISCNVYWHYMQSYVVSFQTRERERERCMLLFICSLHPLKHQNSKYIGQPDDSCSNLLLIFTVLQMQLKPKDNAQKGLLVPSLVLESSSSGYVVPRTIWSKRANTCHWRE